MATVRFSQELKNEILKNARLVFDKQEQMAKDSRPSDEWAEKIYDTLFGQHTAVLNAVPQEFLSMQEHISVESIGDMRCGLRFTFKSKRPWTTSPLPDTEYAKGTSHYDRTEIKLKNHLVWGELFAEVKAWKDRIEEVSNKRKAFVDQVSQIIDAHATLAPALKMWAPLWDLVPEQYKDRHREVKERVKKDVEVNVDLGALTAAVVAHKITR